MTITADWQGEIGSLTFGNGTDYRWRTEGFTGIGLPEFRTYDLGRGPLVPGVTAAGDTLDGRLMVFSFTVAKSTAALTQQAWQTLKAAWKPSTSEQTLDLRMPGMPETTMRVYGRSRGLSGDSVLDNGKAITGVASFMCTDPYWYGAEVSVSTDSSSPIPVANAGDANTRRCTLTVVVSAATPTITNPSDPDSGTIVFASSFTGTAVLDLNAQTCTVSSVSREDLIDPSSKWFVIAPGTNSIAWTGATSIASVTRPAYH